MGIATEPTDVVHTLLEERCAAPAGPLLTLLHDSSPGLTELSAIDAKLVVAGELNLTLAPQGK